VKKLAILGSTGSIGRSTLSICESFPGRYQPVALAAGRNLDEAFAQCLRWRPRLVSLATAELAAQLSARLKSASVTSGGGGIEVLYGAAGSVAVATHPEAGFVVSAIVGVAGLEATYAAVCAGKTIGLANKECLVAAGDLILAQPARTTWRCCPSTPSTTPSTSACAAARPPRCGRSGSPHRAARSARRRSPNLRTSLRRRRSSTPPG
jgi:1-deoxy-D-xylulose 5-phosphate reductoisomerase